MGGSYFPVVLKPPFWHLDAFGWEPSTASKPDSRVDQEDGPLVADQVAGKLMNIFAKALSHGRYATFQLAEVAVPRDLFLQILTLIDDLRRKPVPA